MSQVKGTFVIINERGLHARAASTFVNLTSQYSSRVDVEKDGRSVDGKSILGIVSLVGIRGSEINVTVEGDDAEELLEALRELVANGFDESSSK